MSYYRRGVTLAAWCAGLAGVIVLLLRARLDPAVPPGHRGGIAAAAAWGSTGDPSALFIRGIRLLALGTAIYLLVVTVLALIALSSRSARMIRISNRITVPLVQRVVASSLGVAMAAGSLAGTTRAWAASPAPPPPAVAAVGAESTAPTVVTTAVYPPIPDDPPTLRRLPDNGPGSPSPREDPRSGPRAPAPSGDTVTTALQTPGPTTSEPRPVETTTTAPRPVDTSAVGASHPDPSTERQPLDTSSTATGPTDAPPPNAGGPPSRTTPPAAPDRAPVTPELQAATPPSPVGGSPIVWTVRPGDHLWLIASSCLAAALNRHPTDLEIDHLWRRVIADNRHVLPDPGNPDLLYVGMQIVVSGVG